MSLSDLSPEELQELKNSIKGEVLQELRGEKASLSKAREMRRNRDTMFETAVQKFVFDICGRRDRTNYNFVFRKTTDLTKALANYAFRMTVHRADSPYLPKQGFIPIIETEEDLNVYMEFVNSVLDALRKMYDSGIKTYDERNPDG